MNKIIVCSCGNEFEGQEGFKGNCPKCLKKLVNPSGVIKKHKPCPSYISTHFDQNKHKLENHL